MLWKCTCSAGCTPQCAPFGRDHTTDFLRSQVATEGKCYKTGDPSVWLRDVAKEALDPLPPMYLQLPTNSLVWANAVKEFLPSPPVFTSIDAFVETMKSKVFQDSQRWTPSTLQEVVLRVCGNEDVFLKETLPAIIKSALTLPNHPKFVGGGFRMLQPHDFNVEVSLPRDVVYGLLSISFLCLWPSPYISLDYPDPVNMDIYHMFSAEFFACVVQYFHQFRTLTNFPPGNVVFRRVGRQCCDLPPFLSPGYNNTSPFTSVTMCEGSITEDEHSLQADFANRFIGGGVLCGGAVQEEIRFAVSPECIASLLFCSSMGFNEGIHIEGTCIVADTAGYGHTFRYIGPRTKPNPDKSVLIAIDAQEPGGCPYMRAYRDFVKCYVALEPDTAMDSSSLPGRVAFATGNWGCGAFGGDVQMMSLLQWVVCSFTRRPMRYYPFGNKDLAAFKSVVNHLTTKSWTPVKLLGYLFSYDNMDPRTKPRLFDLLLKQ